MTTAPTTDRVIPGANHRSARDWLEARAELLADWSCSERVLVTVAALLAGVGSIDREDLQAALREVETVDCALDLLADVGLGCA